MDSYARTLQIYVCKQGIEPLSNIGAPLTLNVEVRCGGLRFANAVGDFAGVLARVVGADGVDDEGAIASDGDPGFQGAHLLDGDALAVPLHGDIAGESFGLARELGLLTLEFGLVGGRHHDDGTPCGQTVLWAVCACGESGGVLRGMQN